MCRCPRSGPQGVGESYDILQCTLGRSIDTSPFYEEFTYDLDIAVHVEAAGGTYTRGDLAAAAASDPGLEEVMIGSTLAYVGPDGFGAMVVAIGDGDYRMLVISKSSGDSDSEAALRDAGIRAATGLINAGVLG